MYICEGYGQLKHKITGCFSIPKKKKQLRFLASPTIAQKLFTI